MGTGEAGLVMVIYFLILSFITLRQSSHENVSVYFITTAANLDGFFK